ncbi:hypothetical protein GCM10009789_66950 [Kribbella sancticallisti]|uniref:Uncharacterized protein n=1 Tax=Kribbella sancticallisti TaxID=460087 RepID=A0ABP4QB32_9ACTN
MPFNETLLRHATKPLAKVVSPEQMKDWYHPCDVLDVPGEQVIDKSSSLDETVNRIIGELAWETGGSIAHSLED